MKISIIIPYYNEVDNIPKLKSELIPTLRDLASSNSIEVLFVDDGSTDNTEVELREMVKLESLSEIPISFLSNQGNWGLGKAMQTGFLASSGEVIVTTDCDGTYRFSTIPDLLSYLKEDVDIVTASPYHPEGKVVNVPGYRLLLSKGSSLIYRFLVNWRIHTYTCLFRAYRREVVKDIHFASHGFLAGTELLVKSMLKGYRVAEFPAVLHVRVYGTSKAKLVRTILAHLRFQANVLLHRLNLLCLVEVDSKKKRRYLIRTKYSVIGDGQL